MIPYLISILRGKYFVLGDRVYPVMIPQHGTFPAARLSENGDRPDGTKESVSQLNEHTLTLDLFGNSYKELFELSDAIRTDLDRKHFQPTGATYIADIAVDNMRDGGYEEDKSLYHRIIDLTIYTKPH